MGWTYDEVIYGATTRTYHILTTYSERILLLWILYVNYSLNICDSSSSFSMQGHVLHSPQDELSHKLHGKCIQGQTEREVLSKVIVCKPHFSTVHYHVAEPMGEPRLAPPGENILIKQLLSNRSPLYVYGCQSTLRHPTLSPNRPTCQSCMA